MRKIILNTLFGCLGRNMTNVEKVIIIYRATGKNICEYCIYSPGRKSCKEHDCSEGIIKNILELLKSEEEP